MIKEELKALFNSNREHVKTNSISKELLSNLNDAILNCIDEEQFAPEVFSIYKKFSPMDLNASIGTKSEIFNTMRNFIEDEILNGKFIEALVLLQFLTVKSEILSGDYYYIALCLSKYNFNELAEQFIEIYKTRETNKLLLFLNLGGFYRGIKNYKSAIKYYEKYTETDKTKPVLYNIIADLYAKEYGNQKLEEQIKYFLKSNELNPEGRLSLHGLAFAYEKTGDYKSAKHYYEKLIEQNPTEIDYYNYGLFLIHSGDFENGHKYLSRRFLIGGGSSEYPIDKSKKWDFKTDISDKTLLVHYEEGFGDTFMYCRFVPALKKITRRIIFVVQDEVCELIKNSPAISTGIEVISNKEDLSKTGYDYSIALLDTPLVLGTSADTIPMADGYLDVPQDLTDEYNSKYLSRDKTFKIGIAFKGDKSANYSERDVEENKFNILNSIPGVKLYSLQKEVSQNSGIEQLGNTFENFIDTACAIKNMDIVISTDNVILNLAGALGVKTAGLFNKQTNYRWFKTKGNDTGWYNSVIPIQAEQQDDWAPVFSRLVNYITDLQR